MAPSASQVGQQAKALSSKTAAVRDQGVRVTIAPPLSLNNATIIIWVPV